MGLFGLFGKKGKSKKAAGSKARKGTTKTSAAAVASNLGDLTIPRGPIEIPLDGLQFHKASLSSNPDRAISLTPKNTYQIDTNWPEGEIVNVCTKGARRTTENNWIGFVSERYASVLRNCVLTHGTTTAHAKIEVDKSGQITACLMLPSNYVSASTLATITAQAQVAQQQAEVTQARRSTHDELFEWGNWKTRKDSRWEKEPAIKAFCPSCGKPVVLSFDKQKQGYVWLHEHYEDSAFHHGPLATVSTERASALIHTHYPTPYVHEPPKRKEPSVPVTRAVICVETGVQYKSATEAADLIERSVKTVRDCCNGKQLTAGDYHWRYLDEYNAEDREDILSKKPSKPKSSNSRKIECVEKGTVHRSLATAARSVGLKKSDGISKCCQGLAETAGGYHWRYKD